MKANFAHETGDHITMLNAYHAFKQQADPRAFCHQHFLSLRALQSADSVRQQLARIMESNGLEMISTPFSDKNYYTNIRKALCAGFFMQVAKKDSGKTYVTVKDDQNVLIHPSTVLGSDSDWIIYNEFVLTTKNYVRTVTAVRPEWLLDIAPNYYKINEFKNRDIRIALQRAADKLKRKETYKSSKWWVEVEEWEIAFTNLIRTPA